MHREWEGSFYLRNKLIFSLISFHCSVSEVPPETSPRRRSISGTSNPTDTSNTSPFRVPVSRQLLWMGFCDKLSICPFTPRGYRIFFLFLQVQCLGLWHQRQSIVFDWAEKHLFSLRRAFIYLWILFTCETNAQKDEARQQVCQTVSKQEAQMNYCTLSYPPCSYVWMDRMWLDRFYFLLS